MSLAVDQTTFNHEVLGSSVPVLVNFWAPWCGVCRLVSPMLSELKSKWGERIKLVNINADENLKLATLYKLKNLPTVMLFDQGDLQCRLEHFKSRDDFQLAMSDLQMVLEAIVAYDSCSASV
ncbi:thioredoxin family protein [Thermocoleostomius sinensis]|jgi:thioredoxin 1|uniref:Thioredoxin domain-containing protein n=1 Tax=Thermocoleostomius sinensis A174 TaxID=2016057 RepID=A0A9E9C6W9_9CYAN|nr:thioredoxin domain-containing protein [Thermocoleostomius sinensis]WAL58653.1 thioredoxin domain-containing protein [Thermocoleostomius sinensis A174]